VYVDTISSGIITIILIVVVVVVVIIIIIIINQHNIHVLTCPVPSFPFIHMEFGLLSIVIRLREIFCNNKPVLLHSILVKYSAITYMRCSTAFTYYNLYKSVYEPELYVKLNIARQLKISLAKFRTSNHNLEIEVR
jgi:hypothetical protein